MHTACISEKMFGVKDRIIMSMLNYSWDFKGSRGAAIYNSEPVEMIKIHDNLVPEMDSKKNIVK